VILALSGGEIVYFEMEITGQLVEVDKKEMSGEVSENRGNIQGTFREHIGNTQGTSFTSWSWASLWKWTKRR
jgi:hypothetical protein